MGTVGVTRGPVTLEVSGFYSKKPGENRWALDSGGIDSLSTRLTITPTSRWSGQFSIGRINRRIHASVAPLAENDRFAHVRASLQQGHWATSLVLGRNNDLSYTQLPNLPPIPLSRTSLGPLPQPRHIVSVPTRIPEQIYNSFLIESTMLFRNRNWVWMRAEAADKDSLLLYQEAPFVLLVDSHRYAPPAQSEPSSASG